ncbi:MAG: hypothetical protein R3320_14175 [Nitriliruptorales bacterium]|nr:hypothetical protein [Nitriliruptorales bacterium]
MDAALISKWDAPARGREQQALEVFMNSMAFWQRQAEAGKCEPQEVYFSTTGHGQSIVKGDSVVLNEILESDEWRELATNVTLNVDGWEIGIWATGEEVNKTVEIYSKAIAAL